MRTLAWTVVVSLAVGSGNAAMAQVTFGNSNSLIIPNIGPASQYPSTITVSGYTGTITDVTVTMTGFHHQFVDDMGAMLVGPAGQSALLFDGGPDGATGALGDNSPISLVFSMSGATTIPPDATNLVGGTYLPDLNEHGDFFIPPAPDQPYGLDFNSIIGQQPNGTYSLFIEDFVPPFNGGMGSWSIALSGISPVPEPTSLALLGMSAFGGWFYRRHRAANLRTPG